jgi:hypothetical protein
MALRRRLRGRVRITNHDRWFFVQLYRWFPSILSVLTIIRPETLVRLAQHRAGFHSYWRWKWAIFGRPTSDRRREQVEADRWDDEEVYGGNLRRVVVQEGPRSLAGWLQSFDHVLGDARLRGLKPELEQFAVDAWRPPMCPCVSGHTDAAPRGYDSEGFGR